MTQFRIRLGSLEICNTQSAASGAIWGEIWAENMECHFPGQGWYDAVSSVLDMWLSAIYEYVNEGEERCDLYFMDGPFVIRLNRLPKNLVYVSFVESPDHVHKQFTVPLATLVSEILGCANSFVDVCKTQAVHFAETKTFRRIVENMHLLHSSSLL